MLGWTMDEVGQHSLGDLATMVELLGDRARAERMRESARRAGFG